MPDTAISLAEHLEEFRKTIVVPRSFLTPACKDRIQMNGDRSVKCFGERYHDIRTAGIHAGYCKDGQHTTIVRWTTKYVI